MMKNSIIKNNNKIFIYVKFNLINTIFKIE